MELNLSKITDIMLAISAMEDKCKKMLETEKDDDAARILRKSADNWASLRREFEKIENSLYKEPSKHHTINVIF